MCLQRMHTALHGPTMARRRRATRAVLAGVALLASACADPPFPPGSPYDGSFSTEARIVGFPDTFTAVGQSVQLRLETDERFRNVPVRWFRRQLDFAACTFGCGLVQVDEVTGELIATPTSYPIRWEIMARLGAQLYYDTVTTRQLPASFRLICVDGCAISDRFNAPVDWYGFAVELRDANGVPLVYSTDSLRRTGASFTVRDRDIVDFVNGELWSRFSDGTSWIIREQFGQTDSLLWTVRQHFASVQAKCPATAALGDTVRVVAEARDPGGSLMSTPVSLDWRLFLYPQDGSRFVSRPISQDGSFVVTERGNWDVRVDAQHVTALHSAGCVVRGQQ